MTKISKSNIALRCKRFANNAFLKPNKHSIKRMKLISGEENLASSSDDDHWPMLPPSSPSSSSISSVLSPIEEERISSSSESTASTTSSHSHYLSSFMNSSITSISSISGDEEYDKFKVFHDNRVLKKVEHTERFIENSSMSDMPGTSYSNNHVIINVDASTQCDDPHHSVIEELEHIGVEVINHTLSHPPDVESYHQTKNFAYLLLNLALVSANGNQIKYLLESPESRPFFYYSMAFIGASLIFQLLAKLFSLNSYRYNLSTQEGATKLRHLNGFLVIFTMLITVINLAISVIILLEIYEIMPV